MNLLARIRKLPETALNLFLHNQNFFNSHLANFKAALGRSQVSMRYCTNNTRISLKKRQELLVKDN